MHKIVWILHAFLFDFILFDEWQRAKKTIENQFYGTADKWIAPFYRKK